MSSENKFTSDSALDLQPLVMQKSIHRFMIKPISNMSDPIMTLDEAPSTIMYQPFPETYYPGTFLTGLKQPVE